MVLRSSNVNFQRHYKIWKCNSGCKQDEVIRKALKEREQDIDVMRKKLGIDKENPWTS